MHVAMHVERQRVLPASVTRVGRATRAWTCLIPLNKLLAVNKLGLRAECPSCGEAHVAAWLLLPPPLLALPYHA